MSTIIIQGELEENKKTVTVFKEHFPNVKVKASLPLGNNNTTVLETSFETLNKDKYSSEEILKALECCSNRVRTCSICPYVMEKDCKKRLQLDAVVNNVHILQSSCK